MSTQITREVIRELERRRDRGDALKAARLEEIYKAAPRIREIDRELVSLGMKATQAVLSGGDAVALTSVLAEESGRLNRERSGILAGLGFGDRFLEDVYTCGACKDTGFLGNKRCACFKLRLIDEHYKFSNLHKVLERENFESFRMDLYSAETDRKSGKSPRASMQHILDTVTRFVDSFDEGFENLYFYGHSGLGKTFMCNCVAKALLDMGKSVIYTTSPQLFKTVENARFNRDEDAEVNDAFLDMLSQVDLLIIDDLGSEVVTSVTASALFEIMNNRILFQKSTVISTNFDMAEINDVYSDRVTSRIFGYYTVCGFVGEDIRIKKRFKI